MKGELSDFFDDLAADIRDARDRGDEYFQSNVNSRWSKRVQEIADRLAALSRPTDALTEREAIVAWLRGQLDPVERYDYRINGLIESIERGDHIPALTKDGE